MAQIEGSICSACYANKGFYRAYESTIKPSQFARLDSLTNPHWVDGMVALIGSDSFFRWHDSGDLQGVDHLEKIARVAQLTPKTRHWLPTREYGMIKAFIAKHGALPDNLIVRLSAMYPDKPVVVPKSLQGAKNVAISNVHTDKPMGTACKAPNQNGACNDCRLCWSTDTVSYALH
jgi:hypothetical protein